MFAWLVLKVARLISFRYAWLGEFNCTVLRQAQTNNSAATVCPNYNQCVRVEWQPQWKCLASATWLQNTGTSFHFAVRIKAA